MEANTIAVHEDTIRLRKPFLILLSILVCALIAFFLYRTLNTPPPSFPIDTDITISEGLTVSEITEILAQNHVVRSALYLYLILLYQYDDTYVQAGTYSFDTPLTVREVSNAITTGQYRSPLVSITFPEGFRARDIGQYTGDALKIDSPDTFIPYEGHLFPDTYFISSKSTADELRTLLIKTSEDRLAPYSTDIEKSGFTKEQVLILASIIEREAKDNESKKIVSGILQNRLITGMPLQVDASFDYLIDKESAELTLDDLETDSPYNTYTHTGLPPTPISNPGIESIEAVLYPEKTKFLYYLTDSDGTFHYAKTFEEHKANKARYLR